MRAPLRKRTAPYQINQKAQNSTTGFCGLESGLMAPLFIKTFGHAGAPVAINWMADPNWQNRLASVVFGLRPLIAIPADDYAPSPADVDINPLRLRRQSHSRLTEAE
jgi:hypothetical protein